MGWTNDQQLNAIIVRVVADKDSVGARFSMQEGWKLRNISYPPGDYVARMVPKSFLRANDMAQIDGQMFLQVTQLL